MEKAPTNKIIIMGKKMNLETKSFAAAISFALCCSSLSATSASSASSKNGELSAVLPCAALSANKGKSPVATGISGRQVRNLPALGLVQYAGNGRMDDDQQGFELQGIC